MLRQTFPKMRKESRSESIGISVGALQAEHQPRQQRADCMVTKIRNRYGYFAVQRGIMYEDKYLSSLNASAEDHMIHPHSYLEHGNRSGCESALIEKGR